MDLTPQRADLDRLDDELVELLHRRARLVQALFAAKRAAGVRLRDPAREEEILRRAAATPGPFPRVAEVMRAVLAGCREAGGGE